MSSLLGANGAALQSKKYIGGSGVVTAAGTIEIDFPQPAIGMVWTGAVAVINGPSTTIWTLNINGIPIDILSGAQTAKDIQVEAADIMTITGSNMIGQEGSTINATFTCIESPQATTQLVVPGQDTLFPTNPNGVLAGTLSASSANSPQATIIPLPAGTTFVLAYLIGTVSPPSQTFQYSFSYTFQQAPVFNGSFSSSSTSFGGSFGPFQIVVPPAVNQGMGLSLTVSGSAAQGTLWIYAFSSPQFAQNNSNQPQYITGSVTPLDPAPTAVHVPHATTILTTATTTVLAAPTNIWEIPYIIIQTFNTPAAAQIITLLGLTSGTVYARWNVPIASVYQTMPLGAALLVNEGLQVTNGTSVTISCFLAARALV